MTNTEISADFRERAGDHQGEILVPWEEVSPARTCTLEYRDGASPGWFVVHHYPAGHTGGHRIPDYEAASIILRQLGDWLDGQGVELRRGRPGFYITKPGMLLTSAGWKPDIPGEETTEWAVMFRPDRTTAKLNAMTAVMKEKGGG